MEVISSGEGRELTLTLRGELDHHAAKEAMRKLEWELDAALPSQTDAGFFGRELYGFVWHRRRDARAQAYARHGRQRCDQKRSAAGEKSVYRRGNFPHRTA